MLAGDSAEELYKARKSSRAPAGTGALAAFRDGPLEEEQNEAAGRAGDSDDWFPWLFKRKSGPAECARRAQTIARRNRSGSESKLEDLGPQIDAAKQRMDFLTEEHQQPPGRLSEPARERPPAFRRAGAGERRRVRARKRARNCSQEWVHRLEERDLLFHVLASYEMRKIHSEYCPPIHLQQLKKALVNRDEAKRVEQILEQFPGAQNFHEEAWKTPRAPSAAALTEETLATAFNLPKI